MALRMAAGQGRLVVFGYNAVISHIEWIKGPEAAQYAGRPLSLSGSQVMAYYKDGTVSDITAACSYDPEEGARLDYSGELYVTATYSDHSGDQFTADLPINVEDVDELIFAKISRSVQKEGTSLDLSGARIQAKYTDGTIRDIDAGDVTFDPGGGCIGHMDKLPIQATWRNPDTGSEYSAQYELEVDMIEKLHFLYEPDRKSFAEGEKLDLSGAVLALKYKQSGDTRIDTGDCILEPAEGTVLSSYGEGVCPVTVYAAYETAAGDRYECDISVNITSSSVPVDEIGMLIGEDLGLEFTFDLPADFWDDFQPQEIPCILEEGDYLLSVDDYDRILDYLNQKSAFADYKQAGGIPYMVVPAGKYVSANGKYYISANSEIYIIATIQKMDGRPEQLPAPNYVDYPYTEKYKYNQAQILTFTLVSSDYTHCEPGLNYTEYNSATAGIVRKMAGLGLPKIEDETMYTNYETFPQPKIVNIPGILALPWCWYDDVPHDLSVLREMVQNGEEMEGCTGIRHTGKVPYLTYSGNSLYEEVNEQYPDLYPDTVTYGDQEYVHIKT